MSALAAESCPEAPATAAGDANTSPKFSFRCQNRNFTAWALQDSSGPTVHVACELGHLPYSAENREGRRTGLMILSAASSILTARLMLTDFHKISLLTTTKITDCEDMKAVVTATAASVIDTLPLIELMESCLSPASS